MPRSSAIGNPQPYEFFGTFAGITFWPGGLTLLGAAPGVGKTSWLLRIVGEAAEAGFPAAVGCYEHTPEELQYRLRLQAEATAGGAHGTPDERDVERCLARGGEAVLLSLSDQEDTVRALEETLIQDFGFPVHGPAIVAVDYLQRVPVVGLTGMLAEHVRAGEAAAALRALSRRHGWAVIAAAALEKGDFASDFSQGEALRSLLGDERVPYEADRIYLARRMGPARSCGCVMLDVQTAKDRTGPARQWEVDFWGARFYPALPSEGETHD